MDSAPANSSLPAADNKAPARPAAPAPPVRSKVRIRFRKSGDLRLLSHHDLARCFERLFRRAALPVHRTRGFHPHPRLVFALSLPLGAVGCEEVLEAELDEDLPAEEVHQRVARQAPPGLEILSTKRIDPKSSAQVRTLCYRLTVPDGRAEAVRAKARELLGAPEVWVRRDKPKPGQVPLTTADEPDPAGRWQTRPSRAEPGNAVNLRPFLRDLRLTEQPSPAPAGGFALEIDLWLTPAGTAKPVEVLGLLGLTDLLDAGAVLERARLELQDEP